MAHSVTDSSAHRNWIRALVFMGLVGGSVQLSLAQGTLVRQWVYNPVTSVEAMAVSRDGQYTAVAGFGGVQIYRASNNQLLNCIPEEDEGFPTSVAFSPNGLTVAIGHFVRSASGQYSGSVELRNVSSGALIKQLPTTASFSIDSVAFSPDGKTLADSGRATDPTTHLQTASIELWSIASGYPRRVLGTSLGRAAIAFSKDGSMLAVGGDQQTGGALELWNVNTSKLILSFPTSADQGINSVAFTPDGKALIDGGYKNSSNWTGVVEEWSIASGKLLQAFNTASTQVLSVCVSPDGKSIADCGEGTSNGVVEVWNLATGSLTASLGTSTPYPSVLSFSADGKTLMEGNSAPGVQFWSTKTYTASASLSTISYRTCNAIQFSPDGSTLASAGSAHGGWVELFDAFTGKTKLGFQSAANSVESVSFSTDNKTLATCGQSGQSTGVLELWNSSTGKLDASLSTTATGVISTQFSPNGKTLAEGGTGANGGIVEIWDLTTKRVTETFNTSATTIDSVTFSADGSLLADGGSVRNAANNYVSAGVVEIWSVGTGKLLGSFATAATSVLAVTFSPDGKTLAVGGLVEPTLGGPINPVLEAWNVSKAKLTATLSLTPGSEYLYSTRFSRNGKTLFAGTFLDMEAFETAKFTKVATYTQGGVTSIDISPKGNLLAACYLKTWLGISATPVLPGVNNP